MIILAILVLGLAAGWVAQLVLGERGRPGAEALVAGLVGSLVGGTLANLLAGEGFDIAPSGLIGSIVGAIIVLAVWRAATSSRGTTRRSR
jgi:uncharacterized membrane protein YeaQ/YmgE (transglycosylase-associated protein family)